MLVLTRHTNEQIVINGGRPDEVVITVVQIRPDKVRLGIQAPLDVIVHRAEVQERIDKEATR